MVYVVEGWCGGEGGEKKDELAGCWMSNISGAIVMPPLKSQWQSLSNKASHYVKSEG